MGAQYSGLFSIRQKYQREWRGGGGGGEGILSERGIIMSFGNIMANITRNQQYLVFNTVGTL